MTTDKEQNHSSQTIQNVMRRIIEHYFKFFGNIDKSGNIAHYNMMMKTEDNKLLAERVEENI